MSNINIIEFDFPAAFSIAASDTYTELLLGLNVKDASSTSKATLTTPSSNIARITNFSIPDTTLISTITLTQITNPSSSGSKLPYPSLPLLKLLYPCLIRLHNNCLLPQQRGRRQYKRCVNANNNSDNRRFSVHRAGNKLRSELDKLAPE